MPDFSDEQLTELIIQTIPMIGRTMEAGMRQSQNHISPVHFALLQILEPGQALPQNELAERLQVSPSTFSATVDALVKRGWLNRTPSERDRRITLITSTPAGHEVLEQVHKQALAGIIKMVETLSELEKQQVAEGLMVLRQAFMRNLSKEGMPFAPPPGMPFPPEGLPFPPPEGMPFPPPFGKPFPK